MNLSKRIIMASCALVAIAMGTYGCTVDERNIEEKGLFVCRTDDDCENGSFCAGANAFKGVEGRCRSEKDRDTCTDYDNDGYLAVDPLTGAPESQCATEDRPIDPDDNDPDVFPGATEYCDGKDNSGDGCVDGKCVCDKTDAGCSCRSDASKCEALTENCFGRYSLVRMKDTMCSAAKAGARVCKSGAWTYGKAAAPSGSYTFSGSTTAYYKLGDFTFGEGDCPVSTDSGKYKTYSIDGASFIYVENETSTMRSNTGEDAALANLVDGFCNDGLDHDCNGTPGTMEASEQCSSCADKLAAYGTQTGCLIQGKNDNTVQEQKGNNYYNQLLEGINCTSKNTADCVCIGVISCADPTSASSPVCMRDGQVLNSSYINANALMTGSKWCDPNPNGGSGGGNEGGDQDEDTDADI